MKQLVCLCLGALLTISGLSAQSLNASFTKDASEPVYLETKTYDESELAVTITYSSDFFVNEDGELTVTITLSEDSNDFEASDLNFSSASLVSFSGSGSVYEAVIKPWSLDLNWSSITGDAGISVLAGALTGTTSGASNNRADLLLRTILFNSKSWTGGTSEVTLGQNRANRDPVNIYFIWRQNKSGLRVDRLGANASDFTVTNGYISNISNRLDGYQITLVPTHPGEVRITIEGGQLDNSNYSNVLGGTFYWNATAPGAVITTDPLDLAREPFTATFNFSESVSGFSISDIIVTNATLSNLSGSGDSYTVDVAPIAAGEVTLQLAEATVTDNQGKGNFASEEISVSYDGDAPTVNISAATAVNATFTASITFDEEVTGFELADISLTNATAANFTGSGANYTVDITPVGSGDITIDIAAAAAQDAAGNESTAASQVTVIADVTAPGVVISADGLVNGIFTTTITFSEEVENFELSDIVVGNGTASNLLGSGANYTADITPTTDGDVTINIAADVVQDIAGNNNTAADQVTVSADLTAPGVSISADALVKGAFTATITFDESVSGFELADISLSNATAGNLSGSDDTYTVDIAPTTDGDVTLDIAASVAEDAAGNGNTVANQVTVEADLTAPGVSISAAAIVNAAFTATITFDESVSGFELTDVVLTNGTANNFSGADDTYTVDITPVTDGNITIDILATSAQDDAGNNNPAADQVIVLADFTAPEVVISANSLVNGAFTATITFSEEVAGFELSDIVVSNGIASNPSGSGANYTVDITPDTDGDLTLNIAADVVQDIAGNNNTAADEVTVSADLTAPGVNISADALVNGVFIATITFDESVSGFELADISLSNATASNLSGSDDTYTVDIAPTTDGDVTLDIAASVAEDAAGNGNTVADQVTVQADLTAPTATITADAYVFNDFSVTVTFDESVTGFDATDIAVTNGTLSNFAGSGDNYTFDIALVNEGEITIDIAAGAVLDVATNESPAAQKNITYDATQPTVTITADDYVNGVFTASVTFSESVSGFELADLVVTNAITANLSGSGTDYTIDVTPTSEGAITLDIATGVATDAAGNDNIAATQKVSEADFTVPTARIVAVQDLAWNNNEQNASVTFSEDVFDFTADDVIITNGNLVSMTYKSHLGLYFLTIQPTAEGILTIDVAADVATDQAGNGNLVVEQKAIPTDFTAPVVTISSPEGTASNLDVVPISFNAAEDIYVDYPEDIVVTNGILTHDDEFENFFLEPAGEGIVSMTVPVHVISDDALNELTSPLNFSIISDKTAPTFTFDASGDTYWEEGSNSLELEFSEAISALTVDDFTVSNGTLDALTAGTGNKWTLTITPASEGNVDVTLNAGAVTDQADLTNEEGSFSIIADYASPSIVLSGPDNKVNGTFQMTIEFSEAVTGFEVDDITCSRCVASNLAGSGSSYTVDITPDDGVGSVGVRVEANTVTDVVGRSNDRSLWGTFATDFVAPFVKSISVPDYANATFTATITFNEEIEGFDLSDIVTTNASAANLLGSGTVYTADITPVTDGDVTIDIPEGAVQDLAGNDNIAATQKTIMADFTAPGVVISSDDHVNGTFMATLTFDEAVTGLALSEVAVSNGTATRLTGSGTNYTVTISPTNEGELTIDLPAGVALDVVGNENTAATQVTTEVDFTAPLFTMSFPEAAIGPFTATITFTEPVTGFELSDLTTTNANLSNLLGSDAVYTVDVVPTQENFMFLNLSSNKVQDLAGNGNSETVEQYIPVDFTAPTVAISAPDISNDTFGATFTFSEEVVGFESSDITLTNATIANFTGDGTTFTADITPVSEGNVTLDIAAAIAQDIAGNDNEAADQKTVSIDLAAPEVTITASDLVNGNFVVNINFSENVIGFESSDITLTNGTVGDLTGSDASYSVEILPLDEGNLTIDIAAGVVTDVAGNGNTAAEQSTTLVDLTEPAITITGSDVTDHTITYTFTFSEEVTGFELADLTVENGALSNFSGSVDTYTIDVAGDGSGLMKLTLAASAVQDLAGNGNEEISVENDLDYELAPVFISTPTTSIDNSSTSYYSYAIEVTDDNGDDIDLTAPVLPDWLSLDNIYTVSTAYTSNRLRGIAVDSKGNIFTTDVSNDVIYKFDTEGNQTVFAGDKAGFKDGTGTDASFNAPFRMAIDGEDNLYVADQNNRTIRKITPSGVVSTLAGSNTFGAEDGTGTDARFNSIGDITVDNNTGNIYVITQYSNVATLRQTSPEGVVTTLTSSADGEGIAVDSEGNLFYMNDSFQLIKRDVSGNEAVLAGEGVERNSLALQYIDGTGTGALFNVIYGMEVDSDGNLYLSDFGLLRRVSPEGVVTTLAGKVNSTGNTNGAGTNASFQRQFDIAVVSAEEIYVGDDLNNSIRKVTGKPALLGRPNVSAGNYEVTLEATDGVTEPTSQAFTIAVADIAAEIQSIEILPIEQPDFVYVSDGNVLFEGFPVQYAVTYNKEVFVTGEPYIELSLAGERLAYKSGSGSDRLIFEWTATADLNDNEEISYAGTDALKLNGGSIKDIDGTDMPLVLDDSFDSFLRVDNWTVKSITTTAADGTYGIGDELEFIVEFESDSELLSIDPTYDYAAVILNIENDNNGYFKQYESDGEDGLEPNQMKIRVVVEEGDHSADLDFVRYEEDGYYSSRDGAANLFNYSYTDDYDLEFDGVFEFTNPDLNHSIAAVKDIVIDGIRPTVDISFDNSVGTSFVATLTFSEDISGLELSDLVVSNGIASNLSGSGKVYKVDIVPSTTGAVTLDMGADLVMDIAGNGNVVANQAVTLAVSDSDNFNTTLTAVYDLDNAGYINAANGGTATIVFDKDVTGFEQSDIVTTNLNITNFMAISASEYQVDFEAVAEGPASMDVPAHIATDGAAGNGAAVQLSMMADFTAPGVIITADALVNGVFTATITFDESVTGFELSDIVVGNGSAGNLTGSEADYTVDITPTTDGDVTLDIAAAVAQDVAENDNTVADQLTVSADLTAPGVTIVADALVNGVFTATITFDESVTDFQLTDITVGNGTATNLTGTDADYTVDITPTTDGDVTIDIAAAVAKDAAENDNTAADQLTVSADFTAPGVTISVEDPVSGAFTATITFDESVTGFELSDITVGNGVASNLAGSGADYTADITPTTDGDVTLDIAAAVAQDAAENDNTAADQLIVPTDVTAPAKPVITGISDDTGSSDSDGITNDKGITIHGTAEPNAEVEVFSQFGLFSKVQADSNGDWVVDNTHQNLFELVVNLTAEAIDLAGNRSAKSDVFVLTPDFTAPAKPVITGISDDTGSSDSDGITSDKRITIHGTAEPYAQVDVYSQFGLFSNVQADANGDWVVDNTHQDLFELVVNLTAEAVDLAGNRSAKSDVFVLTPDFTAPDVPVITSIGDDTGVSDSDGITNDKRITIHGTAEPNSKVEIFSQFGLFSSVQADTRGDWIIDNTHQDLFEIVINLTAEAVDVAGNRSTTSDVYVLTPDFTAPAKPVITGISDDTGVSASDGITNDKRITIHGTAEPNSKVEIFSQFGLFSSVQADTRGDWIIDNTHQDLFEIVINLTAEAVDVAGNRSATSDVYVLTPDFTAPAKPVITSISDDTGVSDSDGITNDKRITIHGKAEPNSKVEIFSQFGYFNSTQADGSGDWVLDNTHQDIFEVVVNLTAEAVDLAGNRSATSDVFVLTPDFTSPEVTISVDGSTSEAYTISAVFSEEVSGLTLDEVTITGGTPSELSQQSPTTYSFLVTSSGAVTDVTINADAAQDVAGNGSKASNQLTLNSTPVSNGEVLINAVGFVEPEKRQIVNVYPNPASKWLTLDLSAVNAESVDVAIVSLSGKNVLGLQGFERKELKVDVSGYDNGLYLVLISTGKEVIKKKVLVKK